MMHLPQPPRRRARGCILLALLIAVPAAAVEIDEYVHRADDSFRFEVAAADEIAGHSVLQVDLKSQTWRGITWQHWLTVLVPKELEHPRQAVLIIGGGSNRREPPSLGDDRFRPVLNMLAATGAVVAHLGQVPNQPLFDGRREDSLIAHTFDQYLNGGDDDWPALLPMTKSAVRAMDAVQVVVKQRTGGEIERFIVTGGSKRGWTTYLTATVDDRVKAIVPMVFDILNFRPQLQHQQRSYGRFSEQINDYTDLDIPARMDSEVGERLVDLVDPFTYRDKLSMPKLIVLGTNDPFWTVDAAGFYYHELPGPTYLHYLPNGGHGLGPGIFPTVFAFLRASLNDQAVGEIKWHHLPDGQMVVNWPDETAHATLWQANSPDRDFRHARWQPTRLDGKQRCVVSVPQPAEGWGAYYVEVRSGQMNRTAMSQMTTITVVPDDLPHPAAE